MVFSFFKKQDKKMPERPAARPRAPDLLPEVNAPVVRVEEQPKPLPEPLPDLEFTPGKPTKPLSASVAPKPDGKPATAPQQPPAAGSDFTIDDFDSDDFTESSVMGIDVNQDDDPLQACVEQVVVLYANGQDGAARSLLETFVRSYRGSEGRRFWLLLFDLLQAMGDRAAFEKLGADYAEACEMSPPTWTQESPVAKLAAGAVVVDCTKLVGCDDEVAGRLADLLSHARKSRLSVTLVAVDVFIDRLNNRLVAGENAHEPSWRLLLELLQRHGTQDAFEERAVDFAVTFELSPPSWEERKALAAAAVAAAARPADDAHYLSGELKGCRFDDLIPVIEGNELPVLDFSGVRRLDFISAGQLVNRLAPYKAAGREIVIRSPNHLVAELMAVVGLNKQARILVPKS